MCEYCEYQQNADEEVPIQEGGCNMLICNGDQLVVEDADENVISHTTISFCPMCGETL